MSVLLDMFNIPVLKPFDPANLDWGPDLVVVGNVCRKDHLEVVRAQELGLPLKSMAEVLEEQFLAHRKPLVVAGTHGKTTTTSLVAFLLDRAGLEPGYFVGGVPRDFGRNAGLGSGEPFVVEGDEYDTAFFDKTPKFWHYRPVVGILTSVEYDHADIYPTFQDVVRAFQRFVERIPPDGLLVASTRVPGEVLASARCTVVRYGVEGFDPMEEAAWRAVVESDVGSGELNESRVTIFRVLSPDGKGYGPYRLLIPGSFNVSNALAALLAVHLQFGVDLDQLGDILMGFRGVRRRQEVRGVAKGVTVVDDFAHHPTAVAATLGTFAAMPGRRRLVAVFEPRSATSRRNVLQEDLARALAVADEAFIGPLRRLEGIPEEQRLDPNALVEAIRGHDTPAAYFDDVGRLVEFLAGLLHAGDVVVVMSSGFFDDLPRRLLLRLGDPAMPAEWEDLEDLRRLLERMRLDSGNLAEELDDYLVVRSENGLVGCIGLERLGRYGLLKDLAVVPERRGQGLSWMLGQMALDRAADLGMERVYMFGTRATNRVGEVLGFRPCRLDSIPAEVRSSAQFGRPIHAGARIMVYDLS